MSTTSKKPNILVIFGDDIGWQNVSAYVPPAFEFMKKAKASNEPFGRWPNTRSRRPH